MRIRSIAALAAVRTFIALLTTVSCGALVGCGKSPGTKTVAKAAASASASERHETAPFPKNPRDIGVLFRTEADARPQGTITTEAAFAAFRSDGVQLTDARQHLARPYGARYCMGAKAQGLVAISVCEYIDPQAAETGAADSRKIKLLHREIRINQATSLTVRELEKTPAADALAKRLFASFAKL